MDDTRENKAQDLFQFLRELALLRQKVVANYHEYPWSFVFLKDDPSPWIECLFENRADSRPERILKVTRPSVSPLPPLDPEIAPLIQGNWEDWQEEIQADLQAAEALFESQESPESSERLLKLEAALSQRDAWVLARKQEVRAEALFLDLYNIVFELERQGDVRELVAANGLFFDRDHPALCHPIMGCRVGVEYDAKANAITVWDLQEKPVLYTGMFQDLEEIHVDKLASLQQMLEESGCHPLDSQKTPVFLRYLARQLSVKADYFETRDQAPAAYRFLVVWQPLLIFKKRQDGTLKVLESILDQLPSSPSLPRPLEELISGRQEAVLDSAANKTPLLKLADLAGESADILLSKSANLEQLEIARRIESSSGVLVQGPPGTGKTHTIANLLGHFLAQGKSVLVTSQTSKALSVLKEKIDPSIQNLCVALLSDSKDDMESSVDGITEHLAMTTSYELAREVQRLKYARNEIMDQLAQVRADLLETLKKENQPVYLNQKAWSPAEAARFVCEHGKEMKQTGRIEPESDAFPLNPEELEFLCAHRSLLSESKPEKNPWLDFTWIYTPIQFEKEVRQVQKALHSFSESQKGQEWKASYSFFNSRMRLEKEAVFFEMKLPSLKDAEQLSGFESQAGLEEWMKAAIGDGLAGGAFRQRWKRLAQSIEQTEACSQNVMEMLFGKKLDLDPSLCTPAALEAAGQLEGLYASKSWLSGWKRKLNREWDTLCHRIRLDGQPVVTKEGWHLVRKAMELDIQKKQCASYWNELIAFHHGPFFEQLDERYPEMRAKRALPVIQECLEWKETVLQPLEQMLEAMGIPFERLVSCSFMDSSLYKVERILQVLEQDLPLISTLIQEGIRVQKAWNPLQQGITLLKQRAGLEDAKLNSLIQAMESLDPKAYKEAYQDLENRQSQKKKKQKAWDLLARLEREAPDLAGAVREGLPLEGLEEGWQACLLAKRLEGLDPGESCRLQQQSRSLSGEYRRITSQYASQKAWLHLHQRIENNLEMRQALEGWKRTVLKIGKGTGKAAPRLKAQARQLMSQCQKAVPAWIMPVNKAMEFLDPAAGRFDVLILDEASQSDITALALLYMAKKIVIVGDDQQVSPAAVGQDVQRIEALQKTYVENRIPNWHLYDAKTSVYDLARTTFAPLMLKEHFRCVPDIIGFSNALCYNYKIKPLKDNASSFLRPAVVSFCTKAGRRNGNFNEEEARTITALVMACLERPEYKNKTFGIISMKGEEQARLIQQTIARHIDGQEIVNRRILCGVAPHFQGDERDVIFLSLVDSPDPKGPLKLMADGAEGIHRKRYNVACSRAKEQLWIVHSLDPLRDLKPGDLRKRLLDYAAQPAGQRHEEIERKSESVFECAVAKALSDRGYRIEQQYPAGGYRIDMVVFGQNGRAALECDGERWHSSQEQIQNDLERQTILERLGWRFIRLSGRDFYRNPQQAIESVCLQLEALGIEAGSGFEKPEESQNPAHAALLDRARLILESLPKKRMPGNEDLSEILKEDPADLLYTES